MASSDEKLEKFIKDTSRQLDSQSSILKYIATRIEIQDELADIDREERKKEKKENSDTNDKIDKFIDTYSKINDKDSLESATGKGLLALIAQLNPLTALLYQHAGLFLNTARNLFNFGERAFNNVGNALLGAKDTAGRAVGTVTGWFKKDENSEISGLPAKTGAAALLETKNNSLEDIKGLQVSNAGNLNIDDVTNLKIDNTAAAQLKIHQAMIWADQAVVITKQEADKKQGGVRALSGNVANYLKNVSTVEDEAPVIEETESNAVKTTRALSQGLTGLNKSVQENTEKLKELSGPAVLVALGIGAVVAAIWALVNWLKKGPKLPELPKRKEIAETFRDIQQKNQAKADTITTGVGLAGMNSNSIQEYMQRVTTGDFEKLAALTNIGQTDYSNGRDVYRAAYRTTQGVRTPVQCPFDGMVVAFEPAPNLKGGNRFNIYIQKFSESPTDTEQGRIVVFGNILDPLVSNNQNVSKGATIGFSDGAVTIDYEDPELLQNYIQETAKNRELTDDVTRKDLDTKINRITKEGIQQTTVLDEANKENLRQAQSFASRADWAKNIAIDHEQPWWVQGARNLDKWGHLFKGEGMVTDIQNGQDVLDKLMGTGKYASPNSASGAVSGNITDEATKNGIQSDSNTEQIRRLNNNINANNANSNNASQNVPQIINAGSNKELNSVVFAPDEANDILNISGPYTDATPEL